MFSESFRLSHISSPSISVLFCAKKKISICIFMHILNEKLSVPSSDLKCYKELELSIQIVVYWTFDIQVCRSLQFLQFLEKNYSLDKLQDTNYKTKDYGKTRPPVP